MIALKTNIKNIGHMSDYTGDDLLDKSGQIQAMQFIAVFGIVFM